MTYKDRLKKELEDQKASGMIEEYDIHDTMANFSPLDFYECPCDSDWNDKI